MILIMITDSHLRWYCVSHLLGRWTRLFCNNKWPHILSGLTQLRFSSCSLYMSTGVIRQPLLSVDSLGPGWQSDLCSQSPQESKGDVEDCTTTLKTSAQKWRISSAHISLAKVVMPSHRTLYWVSHHQGLFQWASCSHQVTKVLELQRQSFRWVFRVDFL